MSVAVVGCSCFCLYTLNKPDVMLSRADEIPSWMRYNADKRQKLYTDDKNWKKDEQVIELEKLRKEIGSTHG
ncbi:normal mucosa of esophagus-specific gene 1 protein-like [Haemaphysalis longicornis]